MSSKYNLIIHLLPLNQQITMGLLSIQYYLPIPVQNVNQTKNLSLQHFTQISCHDCPCYNSTWQCENQTPHWPYNWPFVWRIHQSDTLLHRRPVIPRHDVFSGPHMSNQWTKQWTDHQYCLCTYFDKLKCVYHHVVSRLQWLITFLRTCVVKHQLYCVI